MAENGELERATQEELRADLRTLCQGAIRLVLESALQEEVRELVGARRFERMAQRKDVRNGSYLRRLLTSMGQIEVTVPRTRETGSACDVLGRYQRRAAEVDEMIAEAYVSGVSTRKMGAVTDSLLGEQVSRSTVSRVTKRLEDEVEALRTAALPEAMTYVYLDATFLDARWAREVENVAALVAYGVDPDGKRRLLAVTIGAQESAASWEELLQQLLTRGLHGVRLVISDEHAGLVKAVRHLLPEVKRQRCVVHLERNVLAKTPARLRARVAREVTAIFAAPSKAAAAKRLAQFKATLGTQVPEAVDCLEQGFEAATQFYAFPQDHWRRLRSTNGLERLHGEIKRRIRAVGAFPDRASALRLIVAVAVRVTAIWNDRRYLDMSLTRKEENTTKNAA